MGFGDKIKDLRKQAQEAVAEHKEQIQNAVEVASVAANEKTQGKYAGKIAKFGEKATSAVDKFGTTDGDATADDGTAPNATGAGAASGPESVFTTPAPSGPPPSFADSAPAASFDDAPTADAAPPAPAAPPASDSFPTFDE
jgi:hypothetical protein